MTKCVIESPLLVYEVIHNKKSRRALITIILFLNYLLSPITYNLIPAKAQTLVTTQVPNAAVYATYVAPNGTTYIGGSFTQVGPNVGFGAPVDTASGTLAATYPKVNGQILATVSDGAGGWYIGGAFTKVGTLTRNRVARILSDGTVDATFNPNANGIVRALLLSGSTLYIGGSFTTFGSPAVTRNYLAALDATTGTPTSWNPNIGIWSGTPAVYSLYLDGTTLYAGGNFTTIGGTNQRIRVASFDTTTGNLTSWQPVVSNNTVRTIGVSGGITYLGGDFTKVSATYDGRGVPIDISTGVKATTFPKVDGVVRAVVSDGSGGWYIGGDFTVVDSQTRNRLAHVLSDGTLDATWNPNANGAVNAIAISGTTLYVGGAFTTIGGVTRNRIAAIGTDGTLQAWNPNSNNTISAITVSGTTVYIGGTFTTIGGVTRNRIVAIGTDGTLSSWNPSSTATVNAIAVSGSNVYVALNTGGGTTTIGGATRNFLAGIDATTGSATAWNPNPSAAVLALTLSGSTLYVGGSFTTIGGVTRNRICAYDTTTDTITSWNPNASTASSSVLAIAVSGANVYVGGSFTTIGSTQVTRNYLAAIDSGTGAATSWDPNIDNTPVRALAVNNLGTIIYAGGDFTAVSPTTRNRAAAFATDGTLQTWNPNANNIVYALLISGTTVYLGGQFTTIGGVTRNRLAAIGTDGTLASWNPNVTGGSGIVYSLVLSGTTLYAGGTFTTIGATTRNNVAAIDTTTGSATSFNPNSGRETDAIALNSTGSSLYIGGLVTTLNGTARNRAAAIDSNGNLTNFDPNANNTVYDITGSGSTIYLGGDFTTVGGVTRNRIAAVDSTTGALASFNPNANSTVVDLELDGTTLYAGGSFTTVGGLTRNYLVAIDTATGTPTSWNPAITGTSPVVRAVKVDGNNVYINGTFTSVGGLTRNYLASIDKTTGSTTSWDPNASAAPATGSRAAIAISGQNVYAGGAFTTIGGVARNRIAGIGTDGALLSWNPNSNSNVRDIAVYGSIAYVGGDFTAIGNPAATGRDDFFSSINLNDGGTVTSFDSDLNALVRSIHVNGPTVAVGGHFTQASGTDPQGFFALYTQNQYPATPSVSMATISSVDAGTGGTYNVGVGQALSINFTASDPDTGQTVTLSTPTGPTVGTFTANAAANPGTGSFTFTPDGTHLGMGYTFTVRATDSSSSTNNTSTGDLSITVNVVNGPPNVPTVSSATINGTSAGTSGTYNVEAGQALIVNLSSTDPNGSDTVTLSTPSAPSKGTFTAGAAANPGTATYSFTPAQVDVGSTVTFTVRATDNNSQASTSDLTVTVNVINSRPATPAISSATRNGADVGTGGTYNLISGQTLTINFTSSDNNTSQAVTLSTPSAPTVGTFTAGAAANPGTGTFTFTAGDAHINNTYTFTVRATDNNTTPETSQSDLTVTIAVSNSPATPSISSSTIGGVPAGAGTTKDLNIGQALVINFTSSDPDVAQTVTLSTPTAPTVGTFTPGAAANPGTGTFTFTPDATHAGNTYTFTVRATDSVSQVSISDLTVTVRVNSPPVTPTISQATINGAPAPPGNTFNLNIGQALVINFASSDSFITGDTVTLSTPSAPTVGVFTAGALANPGTGTFTFTPTLLNAGNTYNFTVRATDSRNVASSSDLSISIIVAANQPPAAPTITQATVNGTAVTGDTFNLNYGQLLRVTLQASDLDTTNTVTINPTIALPVGTLSASTPGNPASRIFEFTPGSLHSGMAYTISFKATDNLNVDSATNKTITINVAANAPPFVPIITQATINGSTAPTVGNYNIIDGQTIRLTFSAPDPDQNNTVTLSKVNASHEKGIYTIGIPSNPGTAVFEWTPLIEDGINRITLTFGVRAQDNNGTPSVGDKTVSIILSPSPNAQDTINAGNASAQYNAGYSPPAPPDYNNNYGTPLPPPPEPSSSSTTTIIQLPPANGTGQPIYPITPTGSPPPIGTNLPNIGPKPPVEPLGPRPGTGVGPQGTRPGTQPLGPRPPRPPVAPTGGVRPPTTPTPPRPGVPPIIVNVPSPIPQEPGITTPFPQEPPNNSPSLFPPKPKDENPTAGTGEIRPPIINTADIHNIPNIQVNFPNNHRPPFNNGEPFGNKPKKPTGKNGENIPLPPVIELPQGEVGSGQPPNTTETTLPSSPTNGTSTTSEPKGISQSTNVILAGSPTSFTLPVDSEAGSILRSNPLNELDVVVALIDSQGQQFELSANVVISVVNDKPIVIQTGDIPMDVAEGEGSLILLTNDKPIAKMSISIVNSLSRTGNDNGNLNITALKPIISSVKIVRKDNTLKLIIEGDNFYNKQIIINNKLVSTKEKQTFVDILPNEGYFELKNTRILNSQKVIIATYKIINIKGVNFTVTVMNPYGSAVSNISIPAN